MCYKKCFNLVKWFPVLFLIAIVSWSYYAYVIELCILTITEVAKQSIYLVLYHLLVILFLISYYRTIFTKHNYVPNEFHISADNLITIATSEIEDKKRILENISKNLPINTRAHNGVMRYCEICSIIKPDRAHHCSHCDKCILKMDHHCPWVNNCIGHANYKFFLLFLFYAFILCLFVASTVLEYCIKFWNSNMLAVKSGSFHLMFLFIIAIAFCFSTAMLFFYHLYLTCKNRTTLEGYRATTFHIVGPNKSGFDIGWQKILNKSLDLINFFILLPVYTSEGDGIVYESKYNYYFNHELVINQNSTSSSSTTNQNINQQEQKQITYVSDFAYPPNNNSNTVPLNNNNNNNPIKYSVLQSLN